MSPPVVSFDLGHTLIFPRYGEYLEILAGAGVRAGKADLQRMESRLRSWFDEVVLADGLREGIWQEYFTRFLRGLGVTAQGPLERALLDLRDRHQVAEGLWSEPAPGASEVLEELAAGGVRVICISNNDGRLADMVARQGWEDHFELLVDSQDVGVSKPDPAIFNLAMERLGIAPEGLVHIGDYYSVDVVGARRAGVRGILYDPLGAYGPLDCEVITDLRRVPGLIAGEHGPNAGRNT